MKRYFRDRVDEPDNAAITFFPHAIHLDRPCRSVNVAS
jgi:hypothetical protein